MKFLAELRALGKLRPLQVVVLGMLFAALAGLSLAAKAPVLDADVWWHLKTGDWIVDHHAFPHTGLFSRIAANRAWMAYSWGYEVLLSRAYAWFGLLGIGWFGVLLTGAVGAVLFVMLYRLSGRFWISWVLCAAASVSFLFNVLPRPVFGSMILFTVTLALVLDAHRHARMQPMYALPLIFVVWANVHIQFIYGLFVVGLFAVLSTLRPVAARYAIDQALLPSPALPSGRVLGVFAACALCCCIGPYSFQVFEVVLNYSTSKFPYAVLEELQPLDFRHPSDYFLVLLVLVAFAAALRRRDLAIFNFILLIVATVFAFRGLRDAWFLGISAALLLADASFREAAPQAPWTPLQWTSAGALTGLLLLLAAHYTGFTMRGLDRAISSRYPVDAVNFVRRHPVQGPLYNDFGWGGFLIWYMPDHPVSIDGRTDLYGDAVDLMALKSVSGDYARDPFLKEARLVLLPADAPLSVRLSADPQFRLVYADRLAVVLVRVR